MQNTSLDIAALQNKVKILIYDQVNSGFDFALRLALPSFTCFVETLLHVE